VADQILEPVRLKVFDMKRPKCPDRDRHGAAIPASVVPDHKPDASA